MDAKRHQPDDEDARFLEALAHHLLDEDQTARRLAANLKRDVPDYARASLIEIIAAPPGTTYAQLDAVVPSGHRGNGEVVAALARRAFGEGDFMTAEAHARRARELEAKWIEPMLVLAEVIVESAFGDGGWVDSLASEPETVTRLREAETLFDAALETGGQMDPLFRAKVRLERAAVYEALGEHDRRGPSSCPSTASTPTTRTQPSAMPPRWPARGGPVTPLRRSPAVNRPACPPQLVLMYAQLIADRNQPGDVRQAIDLVRSRAGEWPAYPKAFRISVGADLHAPPAGD